MSTELTDKLEIAGPPAGPEIAPTPSTALALAPLPTELHFKRSHFDLPSRRPAQITIGGVRELRLTLDELRARRDATRVSAVLECAGHRRAELRPAVGGVQWNVGAVSEAEWGGLPLRDVLREAGISSTARSVVFQGRDRGVRPSDNLPTHFARAISIEKAFAAETLLAWEMNGGAIPDTHGGPLRAIVPGHYAVDSVKWLERITILDRDFDGPFQRFDYRFFADDADEGTELHELPIHALLVSPAAATPLRPGRHELSGIAWGGAGGVAGVEVRVGAGDWQPALLERRSRWGRVAWRLDWDAAPGAQEIAVRAFDEAGNAQPDEPRWNRLGYANNSVHRVVLDIA